MTGAFHFQKHLGDQPGPRPQPRDIDGMAGRNALEENLPGQMVPGRVALNRGHHFFDRPANFVLVGLVADSDHVVLHVDRRFGFVEQHGGLGVQRPTDRSQRLAGDSENPVEAYHDPSTR